MSDFASFWRQTCGDILPLGYLLKHHFADSGWVRFHSLPAGKRYADTDAEKAMVLARANALADRVIGADGACWMAVNGTPRQDEMRAKFHPGERPVRELFDLPFSHAWTDPQDDPEDRVAWTTYARECRWQSGAFDEAIRLVADDIETGVFWISTDRRAIFAPYDGGVDVVVEGAAEAAALGERFPEWLSPRDDGL